jgi:hypothetical protein
MDPFDTIDSTPNTSKNSYSKVNLRQNNKVNTPIDNDWYAISKTTGKCFKSGGPVPFIKMQKSINKGYKTKDIKSNGRIIETKLTISEQGLHITYTFYRGLSMCKRITEATNRKIEMDINKYR